MALPFSPQQMQTNPIAVNFNNLPLPKISYMPASIQQYYPLVVGTLIDIIQGKANINLLRMFLYNQLSYGGYSNQQFAAAVEYSVRLLEMGMMLGRYQDINQAVVHVSETCLEQLAAVNVSQYPELASMLDQYTLQQVNEKINQWKQLSNELNNFQYQLMQRQQVGLPQQTYQQPMNQGSIYTSHNPISNNQNRFPNVTNTSGVFVTGPTNAIQDTSVNRFSRFSNKTTTVSNQPVQLNVNVVNEPQPVQNLPTPAYLRYNHSPKATVADVALSNNLKSELSSKNDIPEIKWVPSLKHPYVYAYDPMMYTFKYIIDEAGNVTQRLINIERDKMNQNDHFVTSTSITDIRIVPGNTSEIKKIISETEVSIENPLDAGPLLNINNTSLNAYADTSLNDVKYICDIGLATMAVQKNKTNVFRKIGVLVEPIVSIAKIEDFVAALGLLDNFDSVQAMLKNAEGCLRHGHEANVDRASLMVIDKRLTNSFNHYIRYELGLKGGWIESFIEDIGGAIDWHKKKYGEKIHESIYINQKKIISRALVVAHDEFKSTLDDDYFGEGNINRPSTVYFLDFYTIMALNLMSTEIGLELPEQSISAGVFEQATPFFYKIVDKVLSLAKTDDIEEHTHYIKTLDGVMLEVMVGALNKDFYLVRKA